MAGTSRHATLLFFATLFPCILIPSYAGRLEDLCISPGGRFPVFASEGKPPGRVKKGPRDLTLCRVFRGKTCCDVAQTYPALVSVRKLASTGEASEKCLHLWELLECSICDPRVGVRRGPPIICASFCNMAFEACSNAYFSVDIKTQVLSPCSPNDIICGRAHKWASNGTEFCLYAGFSVEPSVKISSEISDNFCYGEQAAFGAISDSWSSHQSQSSVMKPGLDNDFQMWLNDMPIGERVLWAVGGMVLTAGLIFISKRKSYSQRRKTSGIRHVARRLGERSSYQQSG